jgi:hypothetical protein
MDITKSFMVLLATIIRVGHEVIIHGVKVLTFIPFIGLGRSKKIKRVHGGRTRAQKK